jgi:hypothetical protein
MKPFDKALYEATLVAFGKILARYNTFARGTVMKDVGADIYRYLAAHGFGIDEQGDAGDLGRVVDLFVQNGFAEKLEVHPLDRGAHYIWHELFLLDAYRELHDYTDNPFLSCPLNLCLFFVADRHDKFFKLHEKTFDMQRRVTISHWEVIDRPAVAGAGFEPLIIENARLVALADERA